MEFLKTIKKRRSLLSEIVYAGLNIGMAVLLVIIIRTTGSLLLALAVVLMGKWRIFAVRPRYWFANIQANLVGIIVSASYVVLLYIANSSGASDTQILVLQSILVLLDIGWLLFLKSKSKRIYVVSQAAIALFVGTVAIYSLAYNWIGSVAVVLTWLLGYATARHVLGSYDEENHTILLSLVWAFLLAELGWLAYHWTIGYRLPIVADILLPQAAIVILGFGFIAFKAYDSIYHHQKVRMNEMILPLVFTIGIIAVLLIFFNGASTGTSSMI
jgi:hypothetical protein